MPTVSLEPGVVVRRGCPNRPSRMGSRLEVAPALMAITLRHLAAEFDDLATTLSCAAPTWSAGDTIHLGQRTLRVVDVRDDDADKPPVLVVEEA
jgi:hypothetical protein